MQDIALQLQSSVSSKMSLTDTQASTLFSGQTEVGANLQNLMGIKVLREGKSETEGITHCIALKLDIRAAYDNAKSLLSAPMSKADALIVLGQKNRWIDILKESGQVLSALQSSDTDATKADVFKVYMQEPGPSHAEKIAKLVEKIEALIKETKSKIAFVIPESPHAGAAVEVSSAIRGTGVSVFKTKHEAPKTAIVIGVEMKDITPPRKTKTALGLTIQTQVEILLRDATGKVVGGNKGTSVMGTSPSGNEDDALANIDRQLVAHVREALNALIPGLIE
jgi:hypothetical protein